MGNPERFTRWSTQVLKTGRSKGRTQARFHYFDTEKNRWDYKTTLVPKDVVEKSPKAVEKWCQAEFVKRNERIVESAIPEPDKRDDSRTVNEIVLAYLDNQLAIGEIDEGSHYRQLSHYNKHIKPYIGDIGFLSLDRYDLQELFATLNQHGLKQSTIYHYVKIVRKVYNSYKQNGLIEKNPFDTVKLPRDKHTVRKSHLTSEQTRDLLDAVEEEYDLYSPMMTGIYLAFYCGLRRGEICGLRWRNIDFNTNVITIDTAIGSTKGKLYPKLPKGDRVRSFTAVTQIMDYLRDMHAQIDPDPNWFVIGDKEKFYSPHVFTNYFTIFRKKYGLIDAYDNAVIPHGIRHNLATIGIRSGIDMASLSDMMGHSSIAMTTDVYGDVSEMGKRIAAAHLSKQFDKEL